MSAIENGDSGGGDIKKKKTKKRKRSSPFRIRVGCLVALRFRPRENNIEILGPDGEQLIGVEEENDDRKPLTGINGNDVINYKETVSSAHFSEVWTDPLPGHDDGLALIGNRIRCFFPKMVLSEPYNATSRLLEGEVVNVVNYCEEQFQKRRVNWRDKRLSVGTLVDLLIDNKNDKQLKALPFLQRIDAVVDEERLLAMSEAERRSHQNEVRIKGGTDKAIVRVRLSDQASLGITLNQRPKKDKFQRNVEVKWVIRKRVPTKVLRQVSGKAASGKPTDETNGTFSNGKANEESSVAETQPQPAKKGDDTEEPPKKKRKTTTFNKDFSATRYLGDGNDPSSQQEANWRWLAGKYNTFSFLADRPLSRALLKKLSYNFVGEVVGIEPVSSPGESTLAHVTIRRLVLPEHTAMGRSSRHGPYDIFEDGDITVASLLQGSGNEQSKANEDESKVDPPNSTAFEDASMNMICCLRVPIEELVIVRRKVVRATTNSEPPSTEMTVRRCYTFHSDMYSALEASNFTGGKKQELKRCGRCRYLSQATKRLVGIPHLLCKPCINLLKGVGPRLTSSETEKTLLRCDCGQCSSREELNTLSDFSSQVIESVSLLGSTVKDLAEYSNREESGFMTTRFVVKGMNSTDFTFNPHSFGSSLNSSLSKPVSKVKTKTQKRGKKPALLDIDAMAASGKRINDSRISPMKSKAPLLVPDKEIFKPSSARILPYDAKNRKFDVSATEIYQWKLSQSTPLSSMCPEKPRNLRRIASRYAEPENSDQVAGKKKLLDRAARANQRRLVKSIAAMGVAVDTLAGREQHIRFDRSGIHDWGVYVDIDIREGEMIVEYRGEIIGNAVAEKREKKYMEEKIGSDYMFRIDELSVCDATRLGNVARFINASCDPNCYTKIISIDGTKRIVIYAKRDIKAGEELSYDYKFDMEPDPTKRIPCHCGAKECRGFLNWDKRYADTIESNEQEKSQKEEEG